ncbi:uncharacterized protein LOC105703250 [Orussus abietinus]|uniref:uncharacterized protein LOC105703250 n=1 Tax=Orussus abietinus TaxID=222816 RepID=UPI000625F073|nr:uncharacterized protein LOC105703250 [Orussus abietinus]
MVQPVDLVKIESQYHDKLKYSHVERFNKQTTDASLHSEALNYESEFGGNPPFIAGFRDELNQYNFEGPKEKTKNPGQKKREIPSQSKAEKAIRNYSSHDVVKDVSSFEILTKLMIEVSREKRNIKKNRSLMSRLNLFENKGRTREAKRDKSVTKISNLEYLRKLSAPANAATERIRREDTKMSNLEYLRKLGSPANNSTVKNEENSSTTVMTNLEYLKKLPFSVHSTTPKADETESTTKLSNLEYLQKLGTSTRGDLEINNGKASIGHQKYTSSEVESTTSLNLYTSIPITISEKGDTVNDFVMFTQPSMTTSESRDFEEEVYDYEKFKAEYYQQIEENIRNNKTFNYTNDGRSEETVKDTFVELVNFKKPKNCTKEELNQFGITALKCLTIQYQHAKNSTDVKNILSRIWIIVRVWICIYACIAIPCWCQKGWCCWCFRCEFCFPKERISKAKEYFANNLPGTWIQETTGKNRKLETVKYKPTLFELEAYEKFESAIRNL